MENKSLSRGIIATALVVGSLCTYVGIKAGQSIQRKEDVDKIKDVIEYFQDKMRPNENPGRTGTEQREFMQFNDGLRAGINAINDSNTCYFLKNLEHKLVEQAAYESKNKH